MKRQYSKPTLSVERYSLTQAVAACYTKIFVDELKSESQRVLEDPDSTVDMRNLARLGGFVSSCDFSLRFSEASDGTCYHTNANGAFSS